MGEYIAVDLGATSGRVVAARLAGGRIDLRVAHRFPNPVTHGEHGWSWDTDGLFAGAMTGVRAALSTLGHPVSVAVDGWGIDFGLIDEQGGLLAPPRMYRDIRESGLRAVRDRFSDAGLYGLTGVQPLPINSVFQLAAMKDEGLLDRAASLLMIPDLFVYRMTGDAGTEYTNATTTQLIDVRARRWSDEVIDAIGIPRRILAPLRQPGTAVGPLSAPARRLSGASAGLEVVRVASHDTSSGIAAVPASQESFGYVSSGTWSLVGVETAEPVVTPRARELGFSNEGGAGGTTCLLKTLTGLWLLEECHRAWRDEDASTGLTALIEEAVGAGPARSFVDIQHELFLRPEGTVEGKLKEYLRLTGQPPLTSRAETVRCILASLAIGYRLAFDDAESLTGRGVDMVHVVGGGSRNRLLCRLTADACDRPVSAGPAEASSAGNALVQALVHGEVRDLQHLRDISRRSFSTETSLPRAQGEDWTRAAHLIRSQRAAG
ncbi:rhamnulokinase [Streptomyces sp. NPDC055078]